MTDQTNHRISTDLGGQVALVTGAARDLAGPIAQAVLAAAGAKVAWIHVTRRLADRDRGGVRGRPARPSPGLRRDRCQLRRAGGRRG